MGERQAALRVNVDERVDADGPGSAMMTSTAAQLLVLLACAVAGAAAGDNLPPLPLEPPPRPLEQQDPPEPAPETTQDHFPELIAEALLELRLADAGQALFTPANADTAVAQSALVVFVTKNCPLCEQIRESWSLWIEKIPTATAFWVGNTSTFPELGAMRWHRSALAVVDATSLHPRPVRSTQV